MEPDAAVEAGAMALFGEKYGDEVRVVSMGINEAEEMQHSYSTELCGGTHVRRTGDIGLFKIVSESGVSAGVRRIEVLTGHSAELYIRDQELAFQQVVEILKASPEKIVERVENLVDERRKFERELQQARRKLAATSGEGTVIESIDVGGVSFAGKILEGMPSKDLKGLADDMKSQLGSGVVAAISNMGGKASLVVGVSKDLTRKFNAVELVQTGAIAVGGKGGGGRPDMAQAGGPNGASCQMALDAIVQAIEDAI